jgi:hypothetical protein
LSDWRTTKPPTSIDRRAERPAQNQTQADRQDGEGDDAEEDEEVELDEGQDLQLRRRLVIVDDPVDGLVELLDRPFGLGDLGRGPVGIDNDVLLVGSDVERGGFLDRVEVVERLLEPGLELLGLLVDLVDVGVEDRTSLPTGLFERRVGGLGLDLVALLGVGDLLIAVGLGPGDAFLIGRVERLAFGADVGFDRLDLHVAPADDPLARGLVLPFGRGLFLGEVGVGLRLAGRPLEGQSGQIFQGVDLALY